MAGKGNHQTGTLERLVVFFTLVLVLVGAHAVMLWGPVPDGGTRILDNLSGAILTMLLFSIKGVMGVDALGQ